MRFVLKNEDKANKKELDQLDIIQVVQQGGQYQVVIGQNVTAVYDAVMNELGPSFIGEFPNTQDVKAIKKTDYIFDMISGTFAPVIPAIMGSGLLKAVIQMLNMAGWLSAKSGTYAVLSAAGNAVFYFLPIFLGVSFGKKMKLNPYITGSIGAALLEPNVMNLVSANKEVINILGINIPLMNYSSTVVPIVLAVILLKFLDMFLVRFIPRSVQSIFTPMLEIGLMVPATLMFFGPIGVGLGNWIAAFFAWAMVKNAIISCAIFGAVGIVIVSLGLHWAVIPIIIMNLATKGWDPLLATVQSTAFAAAGIALGLAILQKKNKEGQNAIAAFASAFLAGITEPVIYGIYFKYRRTWIYAGIAGLVSGIINGIFQIRAHTLVGGLFTMPTYTPMVPYIISMMTAFGVGLILVLLFGLGKQPKIKDGRSNFQSSNDQLNKDSKEIILAPVNGKLIPLSDVKDETFASGALGKGFAVIPSQSQIYSPIQGRISSVFPTKHAIGIVSDNGVQVLIHLGIDTVNLKGKYFDLSIEQGDRVHQGDVLGHANFEAIKKEGYDPTVIVVVLNSKEVSDLKIDLTNKSGELMIVNV